MSSGEIDLRPGRTFADGDLVTTQKLNDLARPTLRIKEAAVTSRELANNSVTSDKLNVDLEAIFALQDGSVTTAKLADGAVTSGKIQQDVGLVNPRIQGNAPPITSLSGQVFKIPYVEQYNTPGLWKFMLLSIIKGNTLAANGDMIRATMLIQSVTTSAGKYIRLHLANAFGLSTDYLHHDNFTGIMPFTLTVWVVRKTAYYVEAYMRSLNPVHSYGTLVGFGTSLDEDFWLVFNCLAPDNNSIFANISSLEFLPAPPP